MNTISILRPDDLASAFQIEQMSHDFPWTEKTFASTQGKHYLNFKLNVDQQMIGFTITHLILNEATLFNITVHPEYQRLGYGRLLLEHLIQQLETRHITTLWLEVRVSNTSAMALYEILGFNKVLRRYGYYPSTNGREDAIVMALSLAGA